MLVDFQLSTPSFRCPMFRVHLYAWMKVFHLHLSTVKKREPVYRLLNQFQNQVQIPRSEFFDLFILVGHINLSQPGPSLPWLFAL